MSKLLEIRDCGVCRTVNFHLEDFGASFMIDGWMIDIIQKYLIGVR